MGLRRLIGGLPRGPRGSRGHPGDPMGHRVGLMSLFMIHKAYMPVYKWSRFLARTGRDQPKVVQEVLADLKKEDRRGKPTHTIQTNKVLQYKQYVSYFFHQTSSILYIEGAQQLIKSKQIKFYIQNIPFHPLMFQPVPNPSIFAILLINWPNGWMRPSSS